MIAIWGTGFVQASIFETVSIEYVLYVGIEPRSGEQICPNESGVHHVRTIRRLAESERYDAEFLSKVKGRLGTTMEMMMLQTGAINWIHPHGRILLIPRRSRAPRT